MMSTRRLPHLLAALLALAALAAAWPGRAQTGAGDAAGGAVPADSLRAAILAAAEAAGQVLSEAQVDSILAANSGNPPAQPPGGQPAEIPLGLHPSFKSSTEALDSRVDVKNELRISAGFPSTWTVGGRILYDRTLPRELSRESLRTGFELNTGRRLLGAIPLLVTAGRNYTLDEQNKGEATYRRDVSESERVGVTASGRRQLASWLAASLSSGAGASAAESRNNQSLDRTSQDVNQQLAGYLDLQPLRGLSLSTGYSGSGVLSDAELNRISDQIRSTQDSLQLRLEYKPSAKLKVGVVGGRLEKLTESLDFERNEYNLVEDSTRVIIDETRETGIGGRVTFDLAPWERLSFAGSIKSQRDERRVKIGDNKDKDGEQSEFQLQTKIKPWSGASTDISYKESEIRSADFTADKRQLNQEFFVKGAQALSKTFTLAGEAFFLLTQELYVDGKQDRDKAQTRLSAVVSGQATPWLTASSTVQWFQNQDVLIPAANSIASKDKNSLAWKGDLDYSFRGKYKVSQRCEVSVIEEDFYFTKDKNSLSRDYLLLTGCLIPIAGKLALDFEHEFRKRESGSYLPDPTEPGSPKTFFRDSRTKTEILRLGVSYGFREYLRVTCEEEIGRDVDFDYRDLSQEISTYGTLNFGLSFTQKFGRGGSIDAKLAHRSRFGSFVRENQRSLWLPTLTIGYTF